MKKTLTVLVAALFVAQAADAAKLAITNKCLSKWRRDILGPLGAPTGSKKIETEEENLYFWSPNNAEFDYNTKLKIPYGQTKKATLYGKKERKGELFFARESDLIPRVGHENQIIVYKVNPNSYLAKFLWGGLVTYNWTVRNITEIRPQDGIGAERKTRPSFWRIRVSSGDKYAKPFQPFIPYMITNDDFDNRQEISLENAKDILSKSY